MSADKFTAGIVGLGLMGGAFARAFRNAEECGKLGFLTSGHVQIYACDKNTDFLKAAQIENVIDKGFDMDHVPEMLSECNLVIVCLYPALAFEFIEKYRHSFAKGAIVTDIAGVKGEYLKNLRKNASDVFGPDSSPDSPDFISGHPMCGRETEGYAFSANVNFAGRHYILVLEKENRRENVEKLRKIISALGFSHIVETDPLTHDNKIAFTSQLCHVIASALVDSAEDEKVTAFGGGSFEDLTRIAMINAPLWTELFASNKDLLLNQIDNFEKSLLKMRKLIEDGNNQELCNLLSSVREKRLCMRKTE